MALTFILLFFAILFLQSGADKLFNYNDNLNYFKSHFSDSPLSAGVALLLPVLTFLEIIAGVTCLVGAIAIQFLGQSNLAWYGLVLAELSLLSLFFGQRMAKDYAGAAALVPYFLVGLAGFWFFNQ